MFAVKYNFTVYTRVLYTSRNMLKRGPLGELFSCSHTKVILVIYVIYRCLDKFTMKLDFQTRLNQYQTI